MCGFSGFLDPRNTLSATEARVRLTAMNDTIRYRGPDGEGIAIEENVSGAIWAGLGHRRLSIIDLSAAGAQPMESRCGRYIIAYNGEIYNYGELRAELETRGVEGWRGHSDTEVLLEGIARDGVAATLSRADGMFALALLDRQTRSITLARDAFGEKPLAYCLWDGVLLFGSELRSLRAWPGFAPKESSEARAALMQYGYIPAPLTIHETVVKLPPAHLITITADMVANRTLPEPEVWWDMAGAAIKAQQDPFEGSMVDAVDAVEASFARSVERRMVSDVPLGSLLSGGIDSTLTTALMQRCSDAPVRTFTIGMGEEGYDEAPYAEAVARHLGTTHETLMLGPDQVLSELPGIAARYDEPFSDSSQLPTYLVSRMARESVTVALSGDGGDELFAGYNRHFYGPRLWSRMQQLPNWLRVTAGRTLGSIPPNVLTGMMRAAGPLAPRELAAGRAGEKLHKLAHLMGARNRDAYHEALLGKAGATGVLKDHSGIATLVSNADPRLAGFDFASAAMLFDTANYLHDDVLTKVDRASMAVSLETRTPFLNHELFELAWRLPQAYKADAVTGKLVLRELLYRHVPREIVDRPKAGFAMPIGRWLRGPLVDWAESHLSAGALQRTDVFNVRAVRTVWDAHRTGRRDNETLLWSILMYQSWHAAQRDVALGERVA
ncbi:asparagine synthase (glutamine-hydrolyzing) [Sulfitobacter pontiacus]|uniref:asparagine synthase (glutamine-hydrolyzing) n=1 Tax=Sulfitobacter pontiacus TaxID=60137 RepID=UPI0030EB85A7